MNVDFLNDWEYIRNWVVFCRKSCEKEDRNA
jgi:hypothetical protein